VISALPLAVSVGDPAGVGPEVSVRAAARLKTPALLFGDAEQLRALANAEGLSAAEMLPGDFRTLPAGSVGIVDTGRLGPETIALHAPSARGGEAQLRTLECAARAVRDGHARALVTGPTSKAAIVMAGHPFVGQTEYLAGFAGLDADAVTMMFLGPKLRVALVTTHLAILDVPGAITSERLKRTVRHLAAALTQLTPDRKPVLSVAGLNPHAGEGGLFGLEERNVIEPALAELQAEAPFSERRGVLLGPTPAEAVFRAAQRGDLDGVIAMFHDQATIASKLLDWGAAVNTTWGLPFVRTSVDHGVAYDAARDRKADADGMLAAMHMALRLTGERDVV
jgi:4-hydroxythreonine-4-phosphate dehydrogenase